MNQSHTPTVLVLGARGRLGAALVDAFGNGDWRVIGQVRSTQPNDPADTIAADARDPEALLRQLFNVSIDVVINACNPPYPRWAQEAHLLNQSAIAVAKAKGATLMFPGNVYNFGADMPAQLYSDTAQLATTRKGRIRIDMEAQLEQAGATGTQCLIVRAGDFFGCNRGSWFDLVIAKQLHQDTITLPGPLGIAHPWAYAPDLARTFVNVAQARAKLSRCEQIHFPGHTLRLQDVIEAIQRLRPAPYRTKELPWPIIRSLSFAVPMWREIAELAYLWDRQHELVTTSHHQPLIATQTPLDQALRHAIQRIHPTPQTA
jgi:nucleoside-diphosphate-sugar epimerase